MRRVAIAGPILAAGIVAFPLLAHAEGTISGLTAEPERSTMSEEVTFTVLGDGQCNLTLAYGDTEVELHTQQSLPAVFTHTYDTLGTYTARVTSPDNDCPGAGLVQVEIVGLLQFGDPVDMLCALTDCDAPTLSEVPGGWEDLHDYFNPEIEVAWGVFEPGGGVLIGGHGFGTQPGVVRVWGDFAGGYVDLVQLEWGSGDGIGGRFPDDITGLQDHEVHFQVINTAGIESNLYPGAWFAAEDYKVLTYEDPAVRLVSCGDDGNWDRCNDWTDPDNDGRFTSAVSGTTFRGDHRNNWGAIGTDRGTDHYQIELKNGWVLDALDWHVHYQSGEGGVGWPAPEFPYEASSWSPSVSWWVTPNDRVAYEAYVHIKGPRGVPHN